MDSLQLTANCIVVHVSQCIVWIQESHSTAQGKKNNYRTIKIIKKCVWQSSHMWCMCILKLLPTDIH